MTHGIQNDPSKMNTTEDTFLKSMCNKFDNHIKLFLPKIIHISDKFNSMKYIF